MKLFRALACASVLSSMVLAMLAAPVGAAGKTIVVDNDGVQCKRADYTTISAAVAAAPAGSKIQVCAGTYTEQVTIPAGKDGLSLESKPDLAATIKAPTVMADPKAIVRVTAAQDVSIKGFVISGPGGGGCDSIRYGVRLDGGAEATIEKNHITLIRDTGFSGCQNGNAIQVGRMFEGQTATAKIKNNDIDAYQKTGIVVDNANSYAEIEHNIITGIGPTASIAQNGIQISRGATADVKHNTVTDNQYTPGTDSSTGILLYQAGAGVTIDHNTLIRNDVGVYLWFADGAIVRHNESSDNTYDGFDLVETSNATLSHNEAYDNGLDGIYATSDSADNLIDHNKLLNNDEHDAHDDSVGPANTWTHNRCETSNQPGLCD